MIRRILVGAFVLAFLGLIFTPTSAAQTNGCTSLMEWWGTPFPPGWYNTGQAGNIFRVIIAAHNASCPPAPKCNCTSGAPQNTGGKPIYFATGDTYIDETDVSLPGLGGGLTLQRRWNSLWPSDEVTSSVGLFGPNWRSTYEERVFMDGNNWLTYSRGDGSYWSFGLAASGALVVASPANVSATLSQTASYWLLKFQNGEQRQFSLTTGLLTAIIDRNGNTTQLAYDSSNRLTTVTDPASRHLYFNYANTNYPYVVTSVTSDFGVTLSYGYDTQGRLTQVTEPDSTTLTFTYNSQSQITQVTDSNGKVLESHTYDSNNRGLTSSQANGVNALTVTYPQ